MTIRSRRDLEEKVLAYRPELRTQIENDPRARGTLERIAEREFTTYKPFIGGATQKVSSTGRAMGYMGDVVFWGSALAATANPLLAPYMLTGLLLKKGNLVAQAPETVRTFKYMANTRDFVGGIRNLGAKVLSYLPGATFVDRGLSRIAEGRMVKKTLYQLDRVLGTEGKSWYQRAAEEAREAGYTGVKVRSANIVSPHVVKERGIRRAA